MGAGPKLSLSWAVRPPCTAILMRFSREQGNLYRNLYREYIPVFPMYVVPSIVAVLCTTWIHTVDTQNPA